MKILLTGASGYLGSALALQWLRAGHEVSLLLRPESSLKRLNNCEASFEVARCSSDEQIQAFVKKVVPEVVVHTACSYGRVGENCLKVFDANERLGLLILQALLDKSKNVAFINTGSSLSPEVSPYALSKYQFAQWGRMLAVKSGEQLKFINVSLEHMYGAGDDASKFTTHVLHACLRNAPVLKLTSGEQVRDFILIDDVISAYDVLLKNIGQLTSVQDIELGSGKALRIREIVEMVHRLTGAQTELQFGTIAYRPNEAMRSVANLEQMNKLGWRPSYDIESGFRRVIEIEVNKWKSQSYS